MGHTVVTEKVVSLCMPSQFSYLGWLLSFQGHQLCFQVVIIFQEYTFKGIVRKENSIGICVSSLISVGYQ